MEKHRKHAVLTGEIMDKDIQVFWKQLLNAPTTIGNWVSDGKELDLASIVLLIVLIIMALKIMRKISSYFVIVKSDPVGDARNALEHAKQQITVAESNKTTAEANLLEAEASAPLVLPPLRERLLEKDFQRRIGRNRYKRTGILAWLLPSTPRRSASTGILGSARAQWELDRQSRTQNAMVHPSPGNRLKGSDASRQAKRKGQALDLPPGKELKEDKETRLIVRTKLASD